MTVLAMVFSKALFSTVPCLRTDLRSIGSSCRPWLRHTFSGVASAEKDLDTMTIKLDPVFGPDDTFPDLPKIHSDAIRLQVFTHRSFFARPTHTFEDHPDDLSPDNEKYELLGDTVLGLVVTGLLLDMHPGLKVGPSTKVRALIVGNTTLADISLKYKLPSNLRLHPAQSITLRASTNIQADVFESYVGGLYVDQGLESVRAWLRPLFQPYARAAYQLIRTQHGLPALQTPAPSLPPSSDDRKQSYKAYDTPADFIPINSTIGHLALFNQHLQREQRMVEWVYSDGPGEAKGTKTTPMWSVRVMVDGEVYGHGRGNTKKVARNEAAKEGLEKMGIVVC